MRNRDFHVVLTAAILTFIENGEKSPPRWAGFLHLLGFLEML